MRAASYDIHPMIRPLHPSDLEAFAALRRQALLEAPLAFAASPDGDFAVSQFREEPDWVIFGAFVGDTLVGNAGLMRERREKARHRVQLWGMYVAPAHRRGGLGRMLVDTCIARALALDGVTQIALSVTDAAADARRLYERAGFSTWGTQPDALRHAGTGVAEHHMLLRLDGIF
jgi:GNAT superfamily N-acetyltransferase